MFSFFYKNQNQHVDFLLLYLKPDLKEEVTTILHKRSDLFNYCKKILDPRIMCQESKFISGRKNFI